MFWRLSVFTILLLSSLPVLAQQVPQVLYNHVRPAVFSGKAVPVGSLPQAKQMNLSIVLPLRDQSALTSLLGRLYDPSSPDYRNFLSVAEFTEQFSPTVADYQAVVDFAQANGFSVTGTPANRLIVPISGSVALVEKAFHLRMNSYQHPTENRTFYSPDREPSLDLSVPVAHIAGLNNYSLPRPMVTRSSSAQVLSAAAAVGSGPGHSYLAGDIRTAYYGGTALTGSGQAVGLFEFNAYDISDVTASFDGMATSTQVGNGYLLSYTPAKSGTTYKVPVNDVYVDGTSEGYFEDSEQVADIVQAVGMAPGLSQVRVYISGSSDINIFNAMASENIAKQLSCSWTWNPDDPSTEDFIFEEFAAQGQSLFVASGDYGAFDPYEDYQTLNADYFYPADDVWVTSVGGTDLLTNGEAGPWSSETTWNGNGIGSGGGISPNGVLIPSWQAGVATSSNGGSASLRNVPDVAAEANTDNYSCDMGVCKQDWGGTSFAAPRWAGFTALINQQAEAAGNPSMGFLNPTIYALGKGPNYDSDFHDITIGNNDCCGLPISYNAVPGYDLVTGWGSPAGQDLIDALAPPASVGFQLSASPGVLSIAPGASATATITVQDVDGFTGAVDLAISGLPSGVIASFASNPTTETSLVTLTVSSSAIRGSYLLTITGVSGGVTATTIVALQVNAPGFSIFASPTQPQIYVGSSGSTTVAVNDYMGFAGNVNLAVTSGLPTGVTASWVGNPTAGTSLLTLTADDSAAPGISVVTITGTSGPLTATTNVELQVSKPEFILNISPIPSLLAPGSSVTATVTLIPVGNFSEPVTLTAPALPAGVTALFSTNPITETSLLTMTASTSAPVGTFSAQIDGTAANYPFSEYDFQQTVTTSPTPNYAIGVSPASLTVTQGSSVTDTVTLTARGGVSGAVTLSIGSLLPNGVTATFGTNPVVNGTSVLTLSTSSSTAPGVYALLIEGSPATRTTPVTLYLMVKPPAAFTLGVSPASLTVAQGASNTSTMTVTPQQGFVGAVTLSAPVLPNGLTASFTPNPTSGNSTLSLTAGANTPAGNYTAIINGTSGSQTVTTTLALKVAVPPVVTTTALSITPSGGKLTTGASYTLTASVTPASGSAIPTGNVVFTIGSTTQTVPLNVSGVATYIGTAPATAGTLTLSGAYQGTAAFSASSSTPLSETVTVPVIATTTALSITPSGGALMTGTSYTLTALVTPASGSTIPTGSVVFTIGSATQTVALNSSGVANYTGTAPATAGTLTLSAAYQGTATFSTSSSNTISETVSIPVVATTTALSITPGGGSLTTGASFMLTATVTPATGSTVPTGSVVFTIGSATQTVAMNFSGVATYTGTAPATAATLTLSAAYQGTAAFSASTSNTLSETVMPPVSPSFMVVGTAVNVSPGATSKNNSTITVTPTGGFIGSIALTASVTSSPAGSQDQPTLSFGSTNLVAITGASAGTATLTISTTAATNAKLRHPEQRRSPWYPIGGATVATVLLFAVPARRRA
jgi:subtilase family serine protease